MRIVAKKKVANTAKIIMAISITLLVYGIILNVIGYNRLIDPVKDVEVIYEDENTISITTKDGSKVIIDNSDNSEKTRINNTSNREQSNIGIDKENLLLKNTIEKEFGITVLYGDETLNYTVSGVGVEPITDSNLINEKLDELYDILSLYPSDLFKEIKKGGIPLKIIMINKFKEDNITGITDSSYDYANIYIAAIYDFKESFFHESYHYIERYMFKKGANYNSWDSLNPADFSWGTIDGSLSYANTFSEKSYFVNNYAQTSDTEDRASTFEYMMSTTRASCLNKDTPVWNKANYMAMTMETILSSVSPDTIEYWERYIKD